MRVLLSSINGFGHVLAMLPLARAFGAAGHDLRWATNGAALPRLRADGIDVVEAGTDASEFAGFERELAARLTDVPTEQRAATAFPQLFGTWLAPRMTDDLMEAARAWAPDLLVHEQAELAAPLVGAVLGIRTVTHGFGGAVPQPIVAAAEARVAPLWARHGLEVPPLAGCYSDGYIDICPPGLQTVPTAHIARVLPMRPAEAGGRIERADPPQILLTLGTVHNSIGVLSTALSGLRALVPGARITVSVGPDLDPLALGPQPDDVRIERWIDQSALIPACRLVVSHAGSGTTFGALAAGVPLLCLPQGADQFRNASAVAASGAGLALPPPLATAEAIRTAAERLLTEDGFAQAAARIAAEIAAMPSPHEVVERLAATA